MGLQGSCGRKGRSDRGVPVDQLGSSSRLWRCHHSQDVWEGAWCEQGEKRALERAAEARSVEGIGEEAERSSIRSTPSVELAVAGVKVVSIEKMLLVSPSVEAPKGRCHQQKLAERELVK